MKDVQCYELFGGIALKNHAFSFHFHFTPESTEAMRIKCLAQGHSILIPGLVSSTSVSRDQHSNHMTYMLIVVYFDLLAHFDMLIALMVTWLYICTYNISTSHIIA